MATVTGSKSPPSDNIRLAAIGQSLFVRAAGVGTVALAISVFLGFRAQDGFRRFSYSYLTAFMWMLAIGLGSVWWVTLQNLVSAKWSVALRRVVELISMNAPWLGVLSLPITLPLILGKPILYVWADQAAVHADHVLAHKAAYLNPTFFAIRLVFYFGFWTLLTRYFFKSSVKQDRSGGDEIVASMHRVAAPAMIVFALTLTFCAIDLLMSLDPKWFSTIFGVYYFASAVLGINSTLALTVMWLQKQGRLVNAITTEHFHDIGKMMFAFTIFWAYVAFSQFLLIWYANIPEETLWFKERFAHGWGNYSWCLLFGHFVIPFFGLLSRHIKRNRKTLAFWAIWILAMIYLDMYWLVMPTMRTEEIPWNLMDLTCWLGVLGIFIAGVARRAKTIDLLPIRDPRLAKSLAFENI